MQLSHALNAFQQALSELRLGDQVTTFTMSDFAQTLRSNSTQGSDYAWGGHQLILGGAVKGGYIYGTFPNLLLGGPDDQTGNGLWVPTTAVAQMGSTLATWFGVAAADLPSVFSVLNNFSVQNLGSI
jgi:uncharacterized protein (DUF1501 family)